MLLKLREYFWGLLPDKCEMPGCCRQGVRGNESRVDGKIMCDYCHYAYTEKSHGRDNQSCVGC